MTDLNIHVDNSNEHISLSGLDRSSSLIHTMAAQNKTKPAKLKKKICNMLKQK